MRGFDPPLCYPVPSRLLQRVACTLELFVFSGEQRRTRRRDGV